MAVEGFNVLNDENVRSVVNDWSPSPTRRGRGGWRPSPSSRRVRYSWECV